MNLCYYLPLPGLTDYAKALSVQRELAAKRASGELADDLLLLLEHPRVITLGRAAAHTNISAPIEMLEARGVEVHETERGGDVTYHGPGQLVGYPIIDLSRHKKDLHWYLRQLEASLIRALASLAIEGRQNPGFTGVWVEDRKIASIGVHVTRWITFHGFALNVATDLADFDLIIPCGIDAVEMTSIANELGTAPTVGEVAELVARCFGEIFDLKLSRLDLDEFLALAGEHRIDLQSPA